MGEHRSWGHEFSASKRGSEGGRAIGATLFCYPLSAMTRCLPRTLGDLTNRFAGPATSTIAYCAPTHCIVASCSSEIRSLPALTICRYGKNAAGLRCFVRLVHHDDPNGNSNPCTSSHRVTLVMAFGSPLRFRNVSHCSATDIFMPLSTSCFPTTTLINPP
jgi:hypothetical protein